MNEHEKRLRLVAERLHKQQRDYSIANTCEEAADAIQDLAADAARYRWLRTEEVSTDPRYYPFWDEFLAKLTRGGRMDSLIDKWMAMDFCEHEKDAANCGECHGQFGVGS